MFCKLQCVTATLLVVLAAQSLDERAAILLGQQKCKFEQSFCTTTAPAYGGGTKTVEVPCIKKVCEQAERRSRSGTSGSGISGR